MLHDLFSGFHYCVQQRAFNNVNWLRQWKATYGRARLPLLFKKICFNGVKKEYIVSTVKQLYYEAGRQVYDKAEADRQVSESKAQSEKEPTTLKDPPWFVKYSMKLNNLPQFVDVFAGSASVAASVVTEGCPPPIVNDKDPVMVCFAWVFVHRKSELRKRIATM